MTDSPIGANEDDTCGRPCDPDLRTDCCVAYWERMEHEGYWNRQRHCWTDKGWREVVLNA